MSPRLRRLVADAWDWLAVAFMRWSASMWFSARATPT